MANVTRNRKPEPNWHRLMRQIGLGIAAVAAFACANTYAADDWTIILAPEDALFYESMVIKDGDSITPHPDACGIRFNQVLAYTWSGTQDGGGCNCTTPQNAGTPTNPDYISIENHPEFGSQCGPSDSAATVDVDGQEVDWPNLGLSGIHVQGYGIEWLDRYGDVIEGPGACENCTFPGGLQSPDAPESIWELQQLGGLAHFVMEAVDDSDFLYHRTRYADVQQVPLQVANMKNMLQRAIATEQEFARKPGSRVAEERNVAALQEALAVVAQCDSELSEVYSKGDRKRLSAARATCRKGAQLTESAVARFQLPFAKTAAAADSLVKSK